MGSGATGARSWCSSLCACGPDEPRLDPELAERQALVGVEDDDRAGTPGSAARAERARAGRRTARRSPRARLPRSARDPAGDSHTEYSLGAYTRDTDVVRCSSISRASLRASSIGRTSERNRRPKVPSTRLAIVVSTLLSGFIGWRHGPLGQLARSQVSRKRPAGAARAVRPCYVRPDRAERGQRRRAPRPRAPRATRRAVPHPRVPACAPAARIGAAVTSAADHIVAARTSSAALRPRTSSGSSAAPPAHSKAPSSTRLSISGQITCTAAPSSEPSHAARGGVPAGGPSHSRRRQQRLGEREPPVAERAEGGAHAPAQRLAGERRERARQPDAARAAAPTGTAAIRPSRPARGGRPAAARSAAAPPAPADRARDDPRRPASRRARALRPAKPGAEGPPLRAALAALLAARGHRREGDRRRAPVAPQRSASAAARCRRRLRARAAARATPSEGRRGAAPPSSASSSAALSSPISARAVGEGCRQRSIACVSSRGRSRRVRASGRTRAADAPCGLRRGGAAHGVEAAQRLVQNQRQRVQVDRLADLATLALLGRHVRERAEHVAGSREHILGRSGAPRRSRSAWPRPRTLRGDARRRRARVARARCAA